MISRVVLAKLSPTMEEGTVVKWLKQEGDPIKVGDLLAEIETDKANMEMEALGAGVLRKILTPAGGKAPVGAVIGLIADPADDITGLLAEVAPAAAAPSQAAPSAPAMGGPAPVTPEAPPPTTPPASGVRLKASPVARAIAAAHEIPLASIAGSGPGGRIIKRDLAAHVAAPAPQPAAAAAPAVVAGSAVPLSSMRRVIARRMSESYASAPHFFATVEVDMDAAVAFRAQLAAARQPKATYNDLLIKACARALVAFPLVNARWANDHIQTLREIDIGVAVSVPDGLITPVVRGADRKPLLAIAAEVKELARRARERRLRPEEYTGSTFTVSNLGAFGITQFTAIINPPESAILAVGAVLRVPVVDGETIRPGHRMNLTMSSDHRVIDGALAAQFLEHVRRQMENPVALLIE